ncbi:MAG: hypothetical protein ABWZ78_04300, partial [Burkholderiaceae bacterium]
MAERPAALRVEGRLPTGASAAIRALEHLTHLALDDGVARRRLGQQPRAQRCFERAVTIGSGGDRVTHRDGEISLPAPMADAPDRTAPEPVVE